MRRALLAFIPLLPTVILAASPALAEDCAKDVAAAFEKQRTSKAFRVAMTQPSAEGPVDMTVDYIPPGRMLQTVTAAHMPGEQQTMLVDGRAFAGSSGAYEELLPQFAQSIVAEVATAVGPPANLGSFACLGKVTFDGKDLLGYRTSDAPADANPDTTMARTIYVDPASGLPQYNVVAALSGKAEPVLKAVYTYPTDVVIEAPVGAPVQKPRH